MKTINFIVFSVTLLFLATISYSQWSNDFRHTNNSGSSLTSYAPARNIAALGQVIHTVWHDERFGNFEILYKRSTDGGVTWEAVQRLTNNPGNSSSASIAVSGANVVHVVWNDTRDGNYEIYYKRSSDNGVSWSGDERITNNAGNSRYPSVDVVTPNVQIVWEDDKDGNLEIYHKRSTDGGIGWQPVLRITNQADISMSPLIAVSGLFVHLVWQDSRDGNKEIYYNRSTNAGESFTSDMRITNHADNSVQPTISLSGMTVHLAWVDNRDGNDEIYYKRSTDNGTAWDAVVRLTNNNMPSNLPAIASSGQYSHLVWQDLRDGNAEIYYKFSTNAGANWGPDIRLTNDPAVSFYPSICLSGNGIHTLWSDNRDVDWEIYYKRNPTGNPTGITNVSSKIPESFSLSQNYPNPFNPNTKINFSITQKSNVTIRVFDAIGADLNELVNETLEAGNYSADFDGSKLASGVYFYRITAGIFIDTKKMLLVK